MLERVWSDTVEAWSAHAIDLSGVMARRDAAVREWAWAVPTPEAIAAIAAWSPILEVGAGTGYWARLLAEAGADVVATDSGRTPGAGRWWPVERVDAVSSVRRWPGRALLMVWPSWGESWAAEALAAYAGDRFLYVGEPRLVERGGSVEEGATGDARFHALLGEGWLAERVVPVKVWPLLRDRLVVYARRPLQPS
jgi:hypothetical protein